MTSSLQSGCEMCNIILLGKCFSAILNREKSWLSADAQKGGKIAANFHVKLWRT